MASSTMVQVLVPELDEKKREQQNGAGADIQKRWRGRFLNNQVDKKRQENNWTSANI